MLRSAPPGLMASTRVNIPSSQTLTPHLRTSGVTASASLTRPIMQFFSCTSGNLLPLTFRRSRQHSHPMSLLHPPHLPSSPLTDPISLPPPLAATTAQAPGCPVCHLPPRCAQPRVQHPVVRPTSSHHLPATPSIAIRRWWWCLCSTSARAHTHHHSSTILDADRCAQPCASDANLRLWAGGTAERARCVGGSA